MEMNGLSLFSSLLYIDMGSCQFVCVVLCSVVCLNVCFFVSTLLITLKINRRTSKMVFVKYTNLLKETRPNFFRSLSRVMFGHLTEYHRHSKTIETVSNRKQSPTIRRRRSRSRSRSYSTKIAPA